MSPLVPLQCPVSCTMLDYFGALGCQDEKKLVMAYQTLLELSEVEHLQNLICSYNSELDVIYITEQTQDSTNVYVPVHSSFILTPCWLRAVQDKLSSTDPKRVTGDLVPSKVDCKKYPNISTTGKTNEKVDAKRRKPNKKQREMSPKPGCSNDNL